MAYTTIDNPELYFQTVLWTGNGSGRSITLDGSEDMQPNWVWGKNRGNDDNDYLIDSVRGVTKFLTTNNTTSESTSSTLFSSFDSDGFSLGTSAGLNANTVTAVGWCWKAGTSFSNDASATGIGTIDTAGSVSTDAGFSIITWTGNATSSQSVAHGLGAVPKVIFTKNTANGSQPWKCYFESVGNGDYLILNSTDTPATSGVWSSTTPSSTVISISNDTGINGSGNTILAYCFAEKKGYSKFGTYKGNDNANGTFVHTGFAPAWVMIKRTNSVNDWIILDTKRNPINPSNERLLANTIDPASTANTMVDFLSNGFKPRSTYGGINGSSDTFVYLAFAESPFVNSNGVPNNAR